MPKNLINKLGHRAQQSQNAHRKCVIWGRRLIEQAFESSQVKIGPAWIRTDIAVPEWFQAKIAKTSVKTTPLSLQAWKQKDGPLENRFGVMLEVEFEVFSKLSEFLNDLNKSEAIRILILDQIQDPQNFGNLLRSSVFFGWDAVVWPDARNVSLTRTVASASAGAIFCQRLMCVKNIARFIDEIKKSYFQVYGLSGDGVDITVNHGSSAKSAAVSGHLALVVGSEGDGMRALTRKKCDEIYRIGRSGNFESLNAAVAGAIGMYVFS